jgi:hypothetical protein
MKTQAYLVTRTDKPAGLSIRARSAEEAIKKALRWKWMRGAPGYRARLYFAPATTPTVTAAITNRPR